jgi:hypothetical protein
MMTLAVVAASNLSAVPITTSCYEETTEDFVWRFVWDGTATPAQQAFSPQNPGLTACTAGRAGSAAPVFWDVSVTPDFGMPPPTQEMTFRAQHKTAVHPPFEAPEGDPFSRTVASASPGPLGVTDTFKPLFFVNDIRHLNQPQNHFDIYGAIYRRPQLEQTIVQFSGNHIPEPATAGLVTAVLAGFGIWRWKQKSL